ncbi:MAG: DUF1579 family protein [Planctomycetota bacterium]|jgi:hypothetical protein
MNTRIVTFGVATLVALTFVAGTAISEDEEAGPPDMSEMMELMAKYGAPGEHHAELGYYIGKWKTEFKMVMPGAPGMPPTEGSAEFSWLMEGRWLAQRFNSTMMGMPYEGFGLTGWDNYKNKWVQCWVDSMSTTLLTSEGVVVDPEGNVMVTYGLMDEYMTGEHDKIVKQVVRKVDDDTFVFEMWDMGIGPDGAPVFEITYTRVKEG